MTTSIRSSWKQVQIVIFTIGAIVIGLSEVILAFPNYAAHKIESIAGTTGRIFTCFLTDIVPYGMGFGIALFLTGTLIVALSLVQFASINSVKPNIGKICNINKSSLTFLLQIGFGIIVSGITFFLLTRDKPGTGTALIWFGMMLYWCNIMIVQDKRRGTRFGNPIGVKKEWIFLLILVIAELFLVAHDISHWRWAGIPDESHFFLTATAFVDGRLDRFILSENGVFGYHPVLSTYYQILFMKIFGMDIFGWRLSSAFALAISLPFIYLLGRELWNVRTGVFAAIIFGSAQLAVGFSHLGYNNVQVYPIVTASLCVLAWAGKRGSLAGYFLAGWIAGMGFYTYYPARLAPLLTGLLGLCAGFLPIIKKDRIKTVIFVSAIILSVLPLLVDFNEMTAHMLQQTTVTKGEKLEGSQVLETLNHFFKSSEISSRVAEHWFLTLIHGMYYKYPHHFQENPIIDPFTCSLAFIGLWISLMEFPRRFNQRFIFSAFVVSSFVVGAISSHDRPPLTRLLFLTPFFALLAAIAIDRIISVAASKFKTQWVVTGLCSLVFVGSPVIWNICSLHYSVTQKHHGYGDGTTSELIRISTQLPESTQIVYIQHEHTYMQCVDLVMNQYNFNDNFTYIRPFNRNTLKTLSEINPPFAVFYNLRKNTEIIKLKSFLSSRFPNIRWKATDRGKKWSLPYFYVTVKDSGGPASKKEINPQKQTSGNGE